MADLDGLLSRCEELYSSVTLDAEAWSDESLADWMSSIADTGVADKAVAREVRRVVRSAQKLRDFWRQPPPALPPDHDDWRTRVDIAVGAKAWRPLLALARLGLERSPSSERYDDVKARFRIVTGERWMEGVDFDDWLAER